MINEISLCVRWLVGLPKWAPVSDSSMLLSELFFIQEMKQIKFKSTQRKFFFLFAVMYLKTGI